ncbi:molecular chaperone [Herbaspirillum sp. alder98]|uniref:fimbrial biogenesis chaperone n=1 Tax=Herbaspirillum sp. alder98 TaxID=2913096 RepID=UPI001CD8E777|nr:fimbria/pilus periplasmic chaperone [Herbaspirillum sp. alder98]MCA1324592.1 fimbria/pilus periplasmic chaperone [Herbaspirillum sp. alder98]
MKNICKGGVIVAMLVVGCAANAAAVISGTRIVFPSNEREVSVRLSNEGKEPSLIQVWLDDGDEKAAPDQIRVPFVLTPPMFRMDGGKGQTVRMLYNGTPLPQDRETLFWFNMLEVGPKPTGEADTNYMQMAFRTRIKMFFRPKALNSVGQIEDAFDTLRWSLKRNDDSTFAVVLDNPSPYHINLLGVSLIDAGDKPLFESESGAMAEPGKSAQLLIKAMTQVPSGKFKVRYTFLNDFGGAVNRDVELTAPAR